MQAAAGPPLVTRGTALAVKGSLPPKKWAGRQQRAFLMYYKGKSPVNRTKYTHLGNEEERKKFSDKRKRKELFTIRCDKVLQVAGPYHLWEPGTSLPRTGSHAKLTG